MTIDDFIDQSVTTITTDYKHAFDQAADAQVSPDARLKQLDDELAELQRQVVGMRERVINILYLRFVRNQNGYVALVCALLMPALIGFAALVIDTGLLMLARAQAVRAADAIAMACAADLYGHDLPRPTGVSGQIQQVAQALADANNATLIAVTCGHWQGGTFIVTEPEMPDFEFSCSEIQQNASFINACATTVQTSYNGLLHTGEQQAYAVAMITLIDNDGGGCDINPGSHLVR